MPEELLKRANAILKEYEDSDTKSNIKQVSLFDLNLDEPKELEMKEPDKEYQVNYQNQELLTEISNLNLDNLRPIDALNELYKLKKLINK